MNRQQSNVKALIICFICASLQPNQGSKYHYQDVPSDRHALARTIYSSFIVTNFGISSHYLESQNTNCLSCAVYGINIIAIQAPR